MMRNCSQPPAQLGNAGAGRAGKPVRPSLGRPGYPVGGPAPFISVVIAGRESRLYWTRELALCSETKCCTSCNSVLFASGSAELRSALPAVLRVPAAPQG